MPRYQVTAPDGRTVVLEGDSPPTDADLDGIFASLPPKRAAPQEKAQAPGALEQFMGVQTGFAKELPRVALRAAQLPQDVVSGAMSLITDRMGPEAQSADILKNEQQYKARQAVEGVLPKVNDTAGERAGAFVAKAAPTAAVAGLTGGATLPATMLVGGVPQAAQTLSEGGSVGKAVLSGALGAATAGIAPQVQKVAQSLAPRIVNSLIKPLAKQFRFGRDPGRGIVDEGITAVTRPQLAKQIESKLGDLGQQIEKKLTDPAVAGKSVDIRPALAEVDKAIADAAKSGERLLLARLKDLKKSLNYELDPATGRWSTLKSEIMPPAAAHQLKRDIGEATRWTGQAFDNEVNQARVAVYQRLNQLIESAAPGTKALQARYADMLTAKSSLERAMTMQGRNNILSLPDVILGSGGMSAAAALSNPAMALGTGALIAGRHALGSAGAKTVGAQLLAKFPNMAPSLQAALRAALGEETPTGP